MRSKWACIGFIIIVVGLCLYTPSQGQSINHYVEDFTTTNYKDEANTTAWWDTIAGELKLFPFMPTLVGTCDTPGSAIAVAISGDLALVGDYFNGLQVIDISDPSNPNIIGNYDTPGLARSIFIAGDHAFVADESSTFHIIDISDHTNPTLAGTCTMPGVAVDVAASGDYAFMATNAGLVVIDISDPTTPLYVGRCNTPSPCYGVAVSGDLAFMADREAGLQAIDISDPTNSVIVGSCDTPGFAYGIAVSGDHAFVPDYDRGLQVIDISDPTNPTITGTCDTPGYAWRVDISGDLAFVADDAAGGLQVIDISDPANPTIAMTYDTPSTSSDVVISGDLAFVADFYSGLLVIRTSNITGPVFVGSGDSPYYDTWGIEVAGDHAIMANGSFGIKVIDISDQTASTLVGECDTPGYARGIAVSGDLVLAADYESGLQVIDISDPTSPSIVGSCDTPGNAYAIAASGDHAFIADGLAGGFQVIDISDPTSPAIVGNCGTPNSAQSVAISGDIAYVGCITSGLYVVDISDPTSPSIIGSCDTPGYARQVVIEGDHAFLSDYNNDFIVIDISDPTNPTIVGACDTPGYSLAIDIAGNYAFVGSTSIGLQVIDISDPENPEIVTEYDNGEYLNGVCVSGHYLFAADGDIGLVVLQVFQSEVDSGNNIGQSSCIDASNDTILWVSLSAAEMDSISWELSADSGTSWEEMYSYGNFHRLTVPGTDLIWRSTHTWTAPGVNPGVTHLDIAWLYQTAIIDSIVDVPDDQGGWILAHFTRSGYDFPDEPELPISYYGIWRRVESEVLASMLKTQAPSMIEKSTAGDAPDLSGMPVITYDGSTYIQSRPDLTASSFPAGTWVWVATVPAIQQDAYIASVPTTTDSSATGTNNTVFVITAHTTTPSIWYVSEPDSGYSVDNIAPGVPTGLMVAYNTGSGTELNWDECPDTDFQYFCIYRSDDGEFDPSPENLVHMTASAAWIDPVDEGWQYSYKITAVDCNGNESDAASAATVTGDETPTVPKAFALHQNVPNPFNPSTLIRFDLPRAAHVGLNIYDVSGRLVRELVDAEMEPGNKEIHWDGRDGGGRQVASGIYFYRLAAGSFTETRKMVLLR